VQFTEVQITSIIIVMSNIILPEQCRHHCGVQCQQRASCGSWRRADHTAQCHCHDSHCSCKL